MFRTGDSYIVEVLCCCRTVVQYLSLEFELVNLGQLFQQAVVVVLLCLTFVSNRTFLMSGQTRFIAEDFVYLVKEYGPGSLS